MSENKSNNFNTEPLLKEIENVINNGLHKILNEYVDKYDLMEQTHKKILQLATVVNVDSINNCDIVNSTNNNNNTSFPPVQVNAEVDKLQVKFNTLENRQNFVYTLLDKLLMKMDTLTSEINSLKLLPSLNSNTITYDNQPLKNASVLTSEKENIQLEVIEEANEEEELTDDDSEKEEEDEEKDEKEETEVIVLDDESEVEEEVKKVIVIKEEKVTEKVVEKVVVVKKETVEEVIATDDDDVETEEEEVVEEDIEEEAVEEEEEFLEIDIDDITYCTNNEENGFIYELKEDGDVGNKVGYLKEGEPFFYADEK